MQVHRTAAKFKLKLRNWKCGFPEEPIRIRSTRQKVYVSSARLVDQKASIFYSTSSNKLQLGIRKLNSEEIHTKAPV